MAPVRCSRWGRRCGVRAERSRALCGLVQPMRRRRGTVARLTRAGAADEASVKRSRVSTRVVQPMRRRRWSGSRVSRGLAAARVGAGAGRASHAGQRPAARQRGAGRASHAGRGRRRRRGSAARPNAAPGRAGRGASLGAPAGRELRLRLVWRGATFGRSGGVWRHGAEPRVFTSAPPAALGVLCGRARVARRVGGGDRRWSIHREDGIGPWPRERARCAHHRARGRQLVRGARGRFTP